MGFPRQEYWSGLPFSSPGDLPNPGIKTAKSKENKTKHQRIEPTSPALAGGFFATWKPLIRCYSHCKVLSLLSGLLGWPDSLHGKRMKDGRIWCVWQQLHSPRLSFFLCSRSFSLRFWSPLWWYSEFTCLIFPYLFLSFLPSFLLPHFQKYLLRELKTRDLLLKNEKYFPCTHGIYSLSKESQIHVSSH